MTLSFPKSFVILLAVVSLQCSVGNADVVELVTGEQVKGRIESVVKGKLTIKTVAGKLREIPFEDTVEIEFSEVVKPPALPQPSEQRSNQPAVINGGQPLPPGTEFESVEKYLETEAADEIAPELGPVRSEDSEGAGFNDDPFDERTVELKAEFGAQIQEGDPQATPRLDGSTPATDVPAYAEVDGNVVRAVDLESRVRPDVTEPALKKESVAENVQGKKSGNTKSGNTKSSANSVVNKPPIPKHWRVVTYAGGEVSGMLKSFDADSIEVTLTNETLKAVSIPRVYLRQMTFIPDEHLVADAPVNASSDDVVIAKLANNRTTKVVGKVLGIADGSVKFSYQGQEKIISLAKIVRIELGMAPEDADTLNTTDWPVYQHAVVSKSIALPARLTSVDEDVVSLKSVWGTVINLPRKEHLRLETRNGRIEYLSALPVADVAQSAYFGRVIPWQKDKTLAGHAIELDGRSFRHGISVHSKTELTYQLDGRFRQFQTLVGFDRLASPQGNVSLQVSVDGTVVYENVSYRFSDDVEKLDLSVSGGKTLKLIVGFGGGQDVGDRIIWADARLLRVKSE